MTHMTKLLVLSLARFVPLCKNKVAFQGVRLPGKCALAVLAVCTLLHML